jgi:hypothetical protein
VTITVTSPLFAQENGPDHLPGGQTVQVRLSTILDHLCHRQRFKIVPELQESRCGYMRAHS